MGGTERRNEYPRGTGIGNGGREGQDHCLAHLVGSAAFQGDGGGGNAGRASAETFHVAAGGNFSDPEYTANFKDQRGDFGNRGFVNIRGHHCLYKPGIRARIAGTCAGPQADAVIADLRG